MKKLTVITVTKRATIGDHTYSLMSNGKVHVNNHITNENSAMVDPLVAINLKHHDTAVNGTYCYKLNERGLVHVAKKDRADEDKDDSVLVEPLALSRLLDTES